MEEIKKLLLNEVNELYKNKHKNTKINTLTNITLI